MLLVHIEGFLEVARLNSVSRAAETLYVTQPTLTARLHALERELGERLFVRARHGMRLTDAGRAFMPYAGRAGIPTWCCNPSMKRSWSWSSRPTTPLPGRARRPWSSWARIS